MNPGELKSFAASMAKACNVKIINKSEVGWVASMFRKYVLRRFSKYLPDLEEKYRPCCLHIFGRDYVILNFDVGDEKPWYYQVAVITHECQHAYDIREYIRENDVRAGNWLRNYLTDETFRAWAEGTPNTAQAELSYHIFGKYPTPVCDFGSYLIRKESATRVFREGCATRKKAVIGQGVEWIPTQEASRSAIKIYDTIMGSK